MATFHFEQTSDFRASDGTTIAANQIVTADFSVNVSGGSLPYEESTTVGMYGDPVLEAFANLGTQKVTRGTSPFDGYKQSSDTSSYITLSISPVVVQSPYGSVTIPYEELLGTGDYSLAFGPNLFEDGVPATRSWYNNTYGEYIEEDVVAIQRVTTAPHEASDSYRCDFLWRPDWEYEVYDTRWNDVFYRDGSEYKTQCGITFDGTVSGYLEGILPAGASYFGVAQSPSSTLIQGMDVQVITRFGAAFTVYPTPDPVALPASYTTTANTPVEVELKAIPGTQGVPLDRFIGDTPEHGSLDFSDPYHATYAPAFGFIGQDSFTFLVRDNYGSSEYATVELRVTPLTVPIAGVFGNSIGGAAAGRGTQKQLGLYQNVSHISRF